MTRVADGAASTHTGSWGRDDGGVGDGLAGAEVDRRGGWAEQFVARMDPHEASSIRLGDGNHDRDGGCQASTGMRGHDDRQRVARLELADCGRTEAGAGVHEAKSAPPR